MNEGTISCLGMYVSILHRHEQRYVASIMRKYRLSSPSYSFLRFLSEHEGITQRELCTALAVDVGLTSRTMAQLEKEEYITRKRSEHDPRAYELYLSEKAKKIVPELKAAYDQWWNHAWKAIPEKDRQLLADQLARMSDTVSSGEESNYDY